VGFVGPSKTPLRFYGSCQKSLRVSKTLENLSLSQYSENIPFGFYVGFGNSATQKKMVRNAYE